MAAAPPPDLCHISSFQIIAAEIRALSSIQDGLASVSLNHTNHYIFLFSPHHIDRYRGILNATAHTQALK